MQATPVATEAEAQAALQELGQLEATLQALRSNRSHSNPLVEWFDLAWYRARSDRARRVLGVAS